MAVTDSAGVQCPWIEACRLHPPTETLSLAHALSLYAVVVFIRRPSSELDLIRVSPTRRFFSSLLPGSSSQAGQEEVAAGEARETKAAATYP